MAGIYIHFPFCKSKCIYCNFYTIVNSKDIDLYLTILEKEIRTQIFFSASQPIETLYFGGGTPSLINPAKFYPILEAIKQTYGLELLKEFTFEANPEQLTFDYLSRLKDIGVNRLSIGAQSFDDKILALLHRQHSSLQIQQAIENALKAGFTNISIDLIYGIAERDDQQWKKELHTAFSFPITHLSAYSLTVEENSLLSKRIKMGKMPPISENKAVDDYHILTKIAKDYHFLHYEISNFSKEGYTSKHNCAYWQDVPYYGFGAAAHSYTGITRQWNVSNLQLYMQGVKSGFLALEKENLTNNDRFNEYILLGLRTCWGIDLEYIRQRFGSFFVKKIKDTILPLSSNYYFNENDIIRLTEEGFLFADNIAEQLFV